MSRLYFLWAGPEKDQAHLELTKEDLQTIIKWSEFVEDEIGFTNDECSLQENLYKMGGSK